ncbi:MAG: nitroreductase family protein [Kibdelosporangium sp.]
MSAVTWTDVKKPHIPGESRLSPIPPGLRRAIARVEFAVGRHGESAKRAAPSAGACYPYELLLSPAGAAVFGLADLARRTFFTRRTDRHWWDAQEFGCFLVGRPWLTMRKYGRRGYFYHLLDAGHAVLNLSVAAAGTRVPDRRSVSAVAGEAVARGGVLLAAGVLDGSGQHEDPDHWLMHETAASSIHPPLGDIERTMTDLLPPTPDPLLLRHLDRPELAGAIAGRRSAAGLAGTVAAGLVREVVQQSMDLCRQVIPSYGLPLPDVRVFARGELPGPDWLSAALVGQRNLVDASTFVVVHARVADTARQALSPATQRLAMAGGIAGEILYLVAGRAGVGVTGIGGFDPGRWARLCGTEDDVLYVLGLGRAASVGKIDVTSVDGNHG